MSTTFRVMLFLLAGGELPDRPEKRSKDWRQQVENFLNEISKNSELRTLPEFLDFIKPGEMNGQLKYF